MCSVLVYGWVLERFKLVEFYFFLVSAMFFCLCVVCWFGVGCVVKECVCWWWVVSIVMIVRNYLVVVVLVIVVMRNNNIIDVNLDELFLFEFILMFVGFVLVVL